MGKVIWSPSVGDLKMDAHILQTVKKSALAMLR
jgi:hypothetical protein